MSNETFDFYDKSTLKSYNLTGSMRYQLSMLDKLDVFTRKHSENVASIVCRLCEYLHLNKNFTSYCTICAYLHDIGKIFIPPKILQKPSRLTDEEYEVMKTHTILGYKMCMDDLELRPYALGPKYHHECLDGTGYPEGLKGREIPLEDQIIKVADEFDAIVVSEETEPVAVEINEIRDSKGMSLLDIVVVSFVLADDGHPISSTRIRSGEINKKGNILK